MADIKTILRETSVVFGLLEHSVENINPEDYVEFLEKTLVNYKYVTSEIEKISKIDDLSEFSVILNNGYELGYEIKKLYASQGDIKWLGKDVKSIYPIDLSVGELNLSLKEHSFIIKNPSLGSYLNSLTQPANKFKTVHVFRMFAPERFKEWFNYTFNKLFQYPDGVIYENEKKESTLSKDNELLIFKNKSKTVTVNKNDNISEDQLCKKLGGDLLKSTFSKWIYETMGDDEEYVELKNLCSLEAGLNMKAYVLENQNINRESILALFQIYTNSYVYGKVSKPPIVLEVPSSKKVDVTMKNIEVSVPHSQLNMLFTLGFSSEEEESEIIFKVECRYFHGQFNGVPEAKLYYSKNTNLSDLYKKKVILE